MLITAVLVSLIMLAAGSAVENMSNQEYHYISEGYLADTLEKETEELDKTFRKNRENYRKMIGFLNQYQDTVRYNDVKRCYNVTLRNERSVINMQCIG